MHSHIQNVQVHNSLQPTTGAHLCRRLLVHWSAPHIFSMNKIGRCMFIYICMYITCMYIENMNYPGSYGLHHTYSLWAIMYSYFFETPVFHNLISMWIIYMHPKKMPNTRCRDVCFRFFTLSLLFVNIGLDSYIWSHRQFLNTNIRTFLHHLFVFALYCAVRERPLLVVDRGWCLEIAASVKRQFEVRRHVLVGGTLPSTICDIVTQGKEPCRSEKKY